jgi:hypothetical protein
VTHPRTGDRAMPGATGSTAVRPERLPQTTLPSLGDPTCDVCPHPVKQHDAIGQRFCLATGASAIDRACVCRPA